MNKYKIEKFCLFVSLLTTQSIYSETFKKPYQLFITGMIPFSTGGYSNIGTGASADILSWSKERWQFTTVTSFQLGRADSGTLSEVTGTNDKILFEDSFWGADIGLNIGYTLYLPDRGYLHFYLGGGASYSNSSLNITKSDLAEGAEDYSGRNTFAELYPTISYGLIGNIGNDLIIGFNISMLLGDEKNITYSRLDTNSSSQISRSLSGYVVAEFLVSVQF